MTDDAGNSADATINLKMKESFPDLTVTMPEVNVFGGVVLQVSGNKLLIGGEEVASWSDKIAEPCKATFSLNGEEVKDGDVLSQPGTLTITVTNNQERSSSAEITLITNAMSSAIQISDMQVGKEVDLLAGITLANGAELVKVAIEMGGTTAEITDPQHFTPDYPGTCSLIFTVKGKNGDMEEVRADDLTIKPLDYAEAVLEVANMIAEKYPWYKNLWQSTKDFIYPHLLASYAACNWSKQDNRVHIIMGETTDAADVENIWQFTTPSEHAYSWYYRIRALCPDTPIKGCDDYWINLENYINQHPNKIFLVSCAADTGWGSDQEQVNTNRDTPPQRRMLEKENVIITVALGNVAPAGYKEWNENVRSWNSYCSASINSNLNNKITVVWYHSPGVNNYFTPGGGWLSSKMPVGFEKDKGNIVMPMISLIASNWCDVSNDTYSSYPTAVTSAVIWNATSVIMANHPWTTLEDAMTIIWDYYLREETFQYKDGTTNWELVDGGKWYFIEMQKLLDNELLQANKLNSLKLNANEVELPDGKGICYSGIGVQFEFGGKKYDSTNDNLALLQEALKSGKVKWYWNKDRFRKYGGTTTATLKVGIVDLNANLIPDLSLEITKNVQ